MLLCYDVLCCVGVGSGIGVGLLGVLVNVCCHVMCWRDGVSLDLLCPAVLGCGEKQESHT